MYVTIGENIKKYRKLRNYSLQVLADKVGVTKKTIQRYETYQHKVDIDRLNQIAIALNVNVEKLTDGLSTNISKVDTDEAAPISMDGIYDENGNPITIDDFILLQIKNGITVERKFEISTVYLLDQDGNMKKQTRESEVITFRQ
jgi:transcriptional regulator with XRE-family HTH domain